MTAPEPRTIGVVAASHGLQGTVKVTPLSDFPERFLALKKCYWKRGGSPAVELTVRRVKLAPSHVLITFESIRTREAADELRGGELCVDDTDSWPLPENAYYTSDLIGFRGLAEDGADLGELSEIIRGAQDVLSFKGEFGELLVPFVEAWVGDVDTEARTIRIRNWRALLHRESDSDDH